MSVCMHVIKSWIDACMSVWRYVSMHAFVCMHASKQNCMHSCAHVCMHIRMCMIWYVMSYPALSCHLISCHVISWCVVFWCVMLCFVTPFCAIVWYVTPWYAMSWCATLYWFILVCMHACVYVCTYGKWGRDSQRNSNCKAVVIGNSNVAALHRRKHASSYIRRRVCLRATRCMRNRV